MADKSRPTASFLKAPSVLDKRGDPYDAELTTSPCASSATTYGQEPMLVQSRNEGVNVVHGVARSTMVGRMDSISTIQTQIDSPEEYWGSEDEDTTMELLRVALEAEHLHEADIAPSQSPDVFEQPAKFGKERAISCSVSQERPAKGIGKDILHHTSTITGDESIIKIAQPSSAEFLIRLQNLPWGVQWEIARLINSGSADYDSNLWHHLETEFTGTNKERAPRVAKLSKTHGGSNFDERIREAGHDRQARERIWFELDREEEELINNSFKGLGASKLEDNWHGGQVQFTMTVKERESNKSRRRIPGLSSYQLIINRPELGPSNRFTRRFGSRRFIRVRISKNTIMADNKNLINLFKKPFVLFGHVFRAFSAKESSVFLVEVNEDLKNDFSILQVPLSMRPEINFLEFLDYHNPLAVNNKQAMAKWGARFALGLSTSFPGLQVPNDNIYYIDDIEAPWTGPGKTPAEQVLTDGCGFINLYAMRKLQAKLKWERMPSAVQFRLAGAKGLLLLHPDFDETDEPQIWLRESQVKIKYKDMARLDSSQLIIDVLRPSRLKHPSRLSPETIVNIAHNQTHASRKDRHKAFLLLMQSGLENIIDGMMRWRELEGRTLWPDEQRREIALLWHEISKAGGVMASRMARQFTSARARGYTFIDNSDDDDETEAVDEDVLDEVIGSDALNLRSLEASTMRLLDAGFSPWHPFVRNKLKQIVNKVVEKYTTQFYIEVPGSVEVFCVPDPIGVLEPGEVFLKSSNPVFPGPDGLEVDVLVGDVLVGRHPCKLPTDVRKVKAVNKLELHRYTDVIVFPIKGSRSLASELAGGDYDGDRVGVWPYKPLVEQFKNAGIDLAESPKDLMDWFQQESNESVQEFQDRTRMLSEEEKIQELQNVLLSALSDRATVGSYSVWHDNAIYSKGYDHPETRRLAFMFSTSLDGAKTGLRVRSDIYKQDKRTWDHRGPSWKETTEPWTNEKPLERGEGLGKFIMDSLKIMGAKLADNMNKKWDEIWKSADDMRIDTDLTQPWQEALRRAKEARELNFPYFWEEMEIIRVFVEQLHEEYRGAWISHLSPSKMSQSNAFKSTPSSSSQTVNTNGDIALRFSQGPKGIKWLKDERERLQASYAYTLDTQRPVKHSSFALNIAFRPLLDIKAESKVNSSIRVMQDFYNVFDIQSGIKAFSRRS